MDQTILLLVAIVFIVSIYLLYYLLKRRFEQRINTLATQLSSIEFVVNDVKERFHSHDDVYASKQQELQSWQLEHQQVSQQLEHRIKVIQEKLQAYQEQLTQLQQQQPQDRLYTRAQKMVALGADIEEIVQECGLPVAEAEILIAMHKKS
ncbi:DUF2802 domain-containing protein [Thalassotalea insulae]|nr:DUF2802 domain-containing protein [Thalassotalea insulae]